MKNIILSDEGYTSMSPRYTTKNKAFTYFSILHSALQDWNVVIIPTYRRYAEWVVSSVKQMNYNSIFSPKSSLGHKWPSEGGKPCRQVWEVVSYSLKNTHARTFHYVNIDKTAPLWHSGGFEVAILNFHSEHDIIETLYCDTLKDFTPKTCLSAKQLHNTTSTHYNARSLDIIMLEDIVFHAAKRGILKTETTNGYKTRDEARQSLGDHMHTILGLKITDLPLKCPNRSDLELVLQRTLELEEMMMPAFFKSARGEVELRRSFWVLADEMKEFCSVDIDQLFYNKTWWDEVLNSLNSTKWVITYFPPLKYKSVAHLTELDIR